MSKPDKKHLNRKPGQGRPSPFSISFDTEKWLTVEQGWSCSNKLVWKSVQQIAKESYRHGIEAAAKYVDHRTPGDLGNELRSLKEKIT